MDTRRGFLGGYGLWEESSHLVASGGVNDLEMDNRSLGYEEPRMSRMSRMGAAAWAMRVGLCRRLRARGTVIDQPAHDLD